MKIKQENIIIQICKKDITDRYYYHISDCLKDKQAIIQPKIPFEASDTEPDVERICVAPSLAQCLIAIHHKLSVTNEFCVYKTYKKITGFFPIGVKDYEVTEERWLTKPTRFEKVFVYNPKKYNKIFLNNFNELLKSTNACWMKYCSAPDVEKLKLNLKDIQNFLLEYNIPNFP